MSWQNEAEAMKFDKCYSWTEITRELSHYFPELSEIQAHEKIRSYLRKRDAYKKTPIPKTNKKLVYKFNNEFVNIYNLGDVHIGAAGFQEKLFKKYIEIIKNDKNAKVVITGDLIDNATLGSKGCIFTQTMIPQKQKEKAIELLYPIRDKIICVIYGNHELRTFKQTGSDIMSDICVGLGVTNKYCQSFSYIEMSIQGQKYLTYATHNLGKSECKLIQMAKSFSNVDLFLGGHIHTPKHITTTQKISETRQKDIEICICNAWLLDEDYAISASYTPVSLKSGYIRLCSEIKKLEVVS